MSMKTFSGFFVGGFSAVFIISVFDTFTSFSVGYSSLLSMAIICVIFMVMVIRKTEKEEEWEGEEKEKPINLEDSVGIIHAHSRRNPKTGEFRIYIDEGDK